MLYLYNSNEIRIPFTLAHFPAGETRVALDPGPMTSNKTSYELTIKLKWESNEDLINLALLVDAIRRVTPRFPREIHLEIPYFPYARQDRVCSPGESLSVMVIAKFINSLSFATVTITDPHSDVTPSLLDNLIIKNAKEIVINQLYYGALGHALFVAPDAGATKKVSNMSREIGQTFIQAEKLRDVKTGHITGTRVHSDPVGNTNLLVVDDICDGGATFLGLAELLRPLTKGKLCLYVTHGIFSKGLGHLSLSYDAIYCWNFMGMKTENPKLKIIGPEWPEE